MRTIEVDYYNVTFCGASYDNKIRYEMIIIEKFEGEKYIPDSKKVFYFLDNKETIVPKMETVKQIEQFYNAYKNNAKIKCEHIVKSSVIE